MQVAFKSIVCTIWCKAVTFIITILRPIFKFDAILSRMHNKLLVDTLAWRCMRRRQNNVRKPEGWVRVVWRESGEGNWVIFRLVVMAKNGLQNNSKTFSIRLPLKRWQQQTGFESCCNVWQWAEIGPWFASMIGANLFHDMYRSALGQD